MIPIGIPQFFCTFRFFPSQWDEPGLWFILHGVVSFAERTLPYLTGIPKAQFRE